MKEAVGTDPLAWGRDLAEWDPPAEVGEAFLIEHARLGRLTSYTELKAVLERRTGLHRFDFELQAGRTAMGHLLGIVVVDRNRPVTGLMISALAIYLGGDDGTWDSLVSVARGSASAEALEGRVPRRN